MTAKLYSVNHWGSHPDAGNDDCYTGSDFGTLEAARAAFGAAIDDTSVAYTELDGPDIYEIRRNSGFQPVADDSDWRREIAHQDGMMGGCAAYNDAMGY